MKKTLYPSPRTAALVEEAIAILERLENAPESPLTTFLPAPARRLAHRHAVQLRKGQLQPAHPNLQTADQLATNLQRAADRDRIVEEAGQDLIRIGKELRRVAAEEREAAIKTFNAIFNEAAMGYTVYGPDSIPGRRYQRLMLFVSIGEELEKDERRQKRRSFADMIPGLRRDPSTLARWGATAAEILTSPPQGETIFSFPAEDTGRKRLLLRIGVRNASWIGSFERGNKGPSTVTAMPGNTRLFVSAAGAGYIIDACSRRLVERIGDDVVNVGRDESGELFIVSHDDRMLEAFGPEGRVWKTETIGGGFRNLTTNDGVIAGEARPTTDSEWVPFSVDLATGAVAWAAAEK